MTLARLLVVACLSFACTVDDGEDGAEDTTAGDTTGVMASPQYGACPGGSNDECEEPTPFCFEQLGICMKACAGVETCAEAPPEGGATPVCALLEYDAQPFQICALSCGVDADCPASQRCASVIECQDCMTPICQPG